MLQRLPFAVPFQIARVGWSDHRQRLGRARAAVANSKALLAQRLPSLFLGQQRYDPFVLPDETEHGTQWRDRFRRRAEECRTLAIVAVDEVTREDYRKMAATYEEMAKGEWLSVKKVRMVLGDLRHLDIH